MGYTFRGLRSVGVAALVLAATRKARVVVDTSLRYILPDSVIYIYNDNGNK